jgi:nanoRNase/pAp phosphatase (c-di-AMP/oligoRNAs hydrolase)
MDTISLSITYFRPKVERVYDSLGKNYREIGDLERYSQAVKHEIDIMVNRFEREKVAIKDGWFFEFECIFNVRSYIISGISLNYTHKTVIIGEKKGESYRFSIRRQDGKVDVNKMARKLVLGFESSSAGGHAVASSGNFPVKYLEEFKKRLKNL